MASALCLSLFSRACISECTRRAPSLPRRPEGLHTPSDCRRLALSFPIFIFLLIIISSLLLHCAHFSAWRRTTFLLSRVLSLRLLLLTSWVADMHLIFFLVRVNLLTVVHFDSQIKWLVFYLLSLNILCRRSRRLPLLLLLSLARGSLHRLRLRRLFLRWSDLLFLVVFNLLLF